MNSIAVYGGLFLEGLLSFFTPCVLPLVPLYVGYLTQETKSTDAEGNIVYDRKRTLFLTAGFVLGICTVFVLAALGSGFLHSFFTSHSLQFMLAGGFFLILMGLYSANIIQIPLLSKLQRGGGPIKGSMTFAKAWLTGFLFSFAWSPCIGPMLAQAILTASSLESTGSGYLAIACYALGFILIFLLLGLFTGTVLGLLKKYRSVVRYTGITASAAVFGMGCWMLYQAHQEITVLQNGKQSETAADVTGDTEIDKYNFTLNDIDGNPVSLNSYKGKTVLLNFFGTWCHYCKLELPSLQKVHENDQAAVLLVAAPGVNGEGSAEEVDQWMKDNGYTMPVVYDYSLSVTGSFGISGYPTTFIIKPDGSFLGYVPGYVDEEMLSDLLEQAAETEK